jgi:hypothetical protein
MLVGMVITMTIYEMDDGKLLTPLEALGIHTAWEALQFLALENKPLSVVWAVDTVMDTLFYMSGYWVATIILSIRSKNAV